MRIHVNFETKAGHNALLYGVGSTVRIIASQILVTVERNVEAWIATSDSFEMAASRAL
jgi:hypothetical protein